MPIICLVTQEEITRCYAFAKKIITEENQYNRFGLTQEEQIQHT